VSRRFKRVIHTGVCVAFLLVGAAVGQRDDPAARCSSADAILSRYIQALGGREALDRLETRVADAKETEPYSFKPHETATYDYHFEWKRPARAVARYTHVVNMLGSPVPFAQAHFIFDGEVWSDSRGRFYREANKAEFRKRLVFDYPQHAMWSVAADPLMVARLKELYSRLSLANDFHSYPDRCIVQAEGIDGRMDMLFFDATTGLLRTWRLNMVQPVQPYYIVFEFDDYRQAGDVVFPFHMHCDFYKATFRYTKVFHNGPLPDAHFVAKR
jgi:hypothetical protein